MKKIITIFLLLLFIGGGAYIYFSPRFERVAPNIDVADALQWNTKEPITIKAKDNRALKSFELIISDGKTQMVLSQGIFPQGSKAQELGVVYPKGALDSEAKHLKLKVVLKDASFWNFFRGNESIKVVDIYLDTKNPHIELLSHSYSITQGGSALVVFKAEDENLENVYVDIASKQFKAVPYKKQGYYATLVAWPFLQEDFKADIVVTDKAHNISKSHIPFYLKNKEYAVSWIKASDGFINGKITKLAGSSEKGAALSDKFDKLRFVNETMRIANEKFIEQKTSFIPKDIVQNWKIKPFYPLKNGARVASFGDTRHYYYDPETKEEISLSYHVGIDLASIKNAKIITNNAAGVVFVGDNGIYGNMPVLDHGMGLFTIYGHCHEILIKESEMLKAGDVIATTGTSGLALGDHLHFGVLIQGIEVRPEEWMDENWIKLNIDDIFKKADIR